MLTVFAHKLTRKILILGTLVGCLIFLALPESSQADNCMNCDSAYSGAISACRGTYQQCQINGGSNCLYNYVSCWGNAAQTYTSCLQGCGSEYEPGGGRGEDPAARNSCVRSCDEVYWECHDNGGSSTGSYQSCMAGGGEMEDCCFAERANCLGGC